MKRKILLILGLIICLMSSKTDAIEYTKTASGLKVRINNVDISIQFYSPEIVRVIKSPQSTSFITHSLSVVKVPESAEVSFSENQEELTLSSSAISVKINTTTGKIAFYTLGEIPLLSEKDYGIQFTPINDADQKSYLVRQAFMLDKDEPVYGIGQFQEGRMIQRNQRLELLQDILITAIPFFQSTKGYGLFWENYSPTYFTDNLYETSFESSVGDCADYYFMYGGNADGVIARMRELTGQTPMFPYWTYGFWQSKERYISQDETVGVVKTYRDLGVPLDGIIQDWQYWGDNEHWNAMEFLNPKFPDPKKMIDEVHAMNAHMIISCWASFGPKTIPYPLLEQGKMLFDFKTWPLTGGVKVYDAYHPKARDIYWDQMNKGIFSLGMDGWWLDSTEPDHFERKDQDYNQKTHLGSFRKFRNAYPLMTVGGVYDHQRKETSDKRVFILTRSAFAGQQRYSANSWSGDVVSDWKVLRNQISAGLNFSLCGIPYWNSDIGGFFVWNFPGGVKNKAFHEIYVRWLQFGTFCPMMRSHGTDTPREIWQFGNKGTWAYDAIEKYINLRYRLLPYIYSTSWEVTAHSSSMMRALMMDFASDKQALDINDQYLFGKSILVCPVTEPMYVNTTLENGKYTNATEDFSNIKATKNYLPSGTDWFDFWTGEKIQGGQEVEKATPIDIIPLYIKAGSILPMGPIVQYANEKQDPAEIRIYPGANAEFILYDDEKDNYNYEKGFYSTIRFTWDNDKQTLTIENRMGEFPGMLKKRKFEIVLVSEKTGTGLDSPTRFKLVNYIGKEVKIKF